eukprot:6300549-Pyramimonas_sp.AAC.2
MASFNGLVGPGSTEGNSDHVHPICLSSKVTNRKCKPTLQQETAACLGYRIWCTHSRRHRRCARGAWRREEAVNKLGRQTSHVDETLIIQSLGDHLVAQLWARQKIRA